MGVEYMKRAYIGCMAAILLCAVLASAGVGNTIPVNGEHYNLNIIGVDKHGEVGDSDGHTMFVKL